MPSACGSLPIELTASQFALGGFFTKEWFMAHEHSFDGMAPDS
jgi:hypothetical protein